MIRIGCILWVFTMLGIAFSTKLWHFMITQGVMQGIASGFIFPICVCIISARASASRLTQEAVRIPFSVVPEETCLFDWHSVVWKLLWYVQVIEVSSLAHSCERRRRYNFCHYQSDAFALWSSEDHADKNGS